MKTTIKKVYLGGGGGGWKGPVYYVPPTKTPAPSPIDLLQETLTTSYDGITQSFTLTKNVYDKNIHVYFNGVLQEPEIYSVVDDVITFKIIIPTGWKIDVVYTDKR